MALIIRANTLHDTLYTCGKIKEMQAEGIIIEVGPVVSGQSEKGEWRKRDFVLETSEMYKKTICFTLWSERVEQYKLEVGTHWRVLFDLSSRPYGGRWYTEAKAWKLEEIEKSNQEPLDGSNIDEEVPF